MEINALKLLITSTVEQFKTAIASSPVTTQSPPSNAMDTNVDSSMENHTKTQIQIEFADLIQDLKLEMATIFIESRALLKQQLLFSSNNLFKKNSAFIVLSLLAYCGQRRPTLVQWN